MHPLAEFAGRKAGSHPFHICVVLLLASAAFSPEDVAMNVLEGNDNTMEMRRVHTFIGPRYVRAPSCIVMRLWRTRYSTNRKIRASNGSLRSLIALSHRSLQKNKAWRPQTPHRQTSQARCQCNRQPHTEAVILRTKHKHLETTQNLFDTSAR